VSHDEECVASVSVNDWKTMNAVLIQHLYCFKQARLRRYVYQRLRVLHQLIYNHQRHTRSTCIASEELTQHLCDITELTLHLCYIMWLPQHLCDISRLTLHLCDFTWLPQHLCDISRLTLHLYDFTWLPQHLCDITKLRE